MHLLNSGPQISVADIDALERELAFALPMDYRHFMLKQNGGVPDAYPTVFCIPDASNLARFLVGELGANKESGHARTPEGFIWHHVEDGETLQLVPFDIHLVTGRHVSIHQYQEKNPIANPFEGTDRWTAISRSQVSSVSGSTNDTMHVFFRVIGEPDPGSIIWNYRALGNRIPSDFLPIASDGSGNIICIALSGGDKGSVYLWDWYAESAPPSYGNIHILASSFTDFVAGLRLA